MCVRHWRSLWVLNANHRNYLVVSEHVVKGIAQVVSTLLDLQLLPVDLVLDVVNPLVELGDVHLAVLEPPLGHL